MRKCTRSEQLGRRRLLIGLVIGLGALVTVRGSLAESGPFREELRPAPLLRYREILEHVVVVPVYLNGQGPFDLVLDTAATFTTLDPALAAELGLTPLGRGLTVTISGARTATGARLDRVQLGATVVSDVEVRCAEIAVLRAADRRIRGILGQSALARVSFGLDHARRLVLFEPPARPDAVLPLDHREGRPAVPFQPMRSSESLWLVLDSGVSTPVLFEKRDTPLPVPRVAHGYFEAETNSGTARLSMAHLEGQVNGIPVPPTLAAVQHESAAGGRGEDGLLPTRLFRVVYFDRAAGRILLRR